MNYARETYAMHTCSYRIEDNIQSKTKKKKKKKRHKVYTKKKKTRNKKKINWKKLNSVFGFRCTLYNVLACMVNARPMFRCIHCYGVSDSTSTLISQTQNRPKQAEKYMGKLCYYDKMFINSVLTSISMSGPNNWEPNVKEQQASKPANETSNEYQQ